MESSASPFEIITPSKPKGGKKGIIIAIVVVVFLILGIVAGVLLVKQRQEIREKAAGNTCPAAEACPVPQQKSLLRNCTPPEADGSPAESLCNRKGRVESCGGEEFCCPTAGQAWTKDLTKCAASSPTATATTTASSTSTATATSGSTSTAKATATTSPTKTSAPTTSPTKAPIPETGTSWPTIMGIGLGVVVIVGSFLLAF